LGLGEPSLRIDVVELRSLDQHVVGAGEGSVLALHAMARNSRSAAFLNTQRRPSSMEWVNTSQRLDQLGAAFVQECMPRFDCGAAAFVAHGNALRHRQQLIDLRALCLLSRAISTSMIGPGLREAS
jgi:hypothetical protein